MQNQRHPAWLRCALDYIPQWLDFQVERYEQPGCTVAIAREGELIAEFAFGKANLRTGKPLTPRHRFRIASHSKTFTASGVMLLREQGRLGLDDAVGRYVSGLHKDLAHARIGELLSHGAGVIRDGDDAGQFQDRRPFLTREELRAALARKQPLAPGVQLKYSNHGYGLLGLLIEEVTGEDYTAWMQRHVIEAAGLEETVADMPLLPRKAPMASGHSSDFPFRQRLLVPGDAPCNAIAAAGGFVSTAADVARFFAQLAPEAATSILTAASRRDMLQRRWRDMVNPLESYYGLGTMLSGTGPREWVGHTGSLQGFVSRTARYTASGFTITVLCNAQDGFAYPWVDGIASILDAFRKHGAPGAREASWAGRWWNMWGAIDLVPMGKVVCHLAPVMNPPFGDATTEARVAGRDVCLIERTSAYNSPAQTIRRVRGPGGEVKEIWVGGSMLGTREALLAEARGRYAATAPGRTSVLSRKYLGTGSDPAGMIRPLAKGGQDWPS